MNGILEYLLKLKADISGANAVKGAMNGVSGGVEGARKNLGRFKESMEKLSAAAPELGMIGRAIFNPIQGAVLAASMAYTSAKAALDNWISSIKEIQVTPFTADQRAKALAEQWQNARMEAGKYYRDLKKAQSGEKDESEKLSAREKAIRDAGKAQKEAILARTPDLLKESIGKQIDQTIEDRVEADHQVAMDRAKAKQADKIKAEKEQMRRAELEKVRRQIALKKEDLSRTETDLEANKKIADEMQQKAADYHDDPGKTYAKKALKVGTFLGIPPAIFARKLYNEYSDAKMESFDSGASAASRDVALNRDRRTQLTVELGNLLLQEAAQAAGVDDMQAGNISRTRFIVGSESTRRQDDRAAIDMAKDINEIRRFVDGFNIDLSTFTSRR